jgi:hypothetical protein
LRRVNSHSTGRDVAAMEQLFNGLSTGTGPDYPGGGSILNDGVQNEACVRLARRKAGGREGRELHALAVPFPIALAQKRTAAPNRATRGFTSAVWPLFICRSTFKYLRPA